MGQMLEIRPIMNSTSEDVLSFRTCCSIRVWDQNLEIHVINRGDQLVQVPSYCDIEGEGATRRISTLLPAGTHTIAPGELKAFYCFMDEQDWNKVRRIVFYDAHGNRYAADLPA